MSSKLAKRCESFVINDCLKSILQNVLIEMVEVQSRVQLHNFGADNNLDGKVYVLPA